jgi:hypothetical protein
VQDLLLGDAKHLTLDDEEQVDLGEIDYAVLSLEYETFET